MIDQENKRAERKETLGSVGSKDRLLCVGGKQERDVGPSQAMEGDVSCHYCYIVRVAVFGLLRRQLNIIVF